MENSFVLYTSYKEILQDLTVEEMGYIFKAILEYKDTGKIIDLPKPLLITFRFIKNQLDMDKEKYIAKIEKLKANGLKGGRPKKQENKNQKANGFFKNHNVNDNVNVNVNDNVDVNVNDNVNTKKEIDKEKSVPKALPTKFEKPTKKELKDFALQEHLRTDLIDEFFDYYDSNGWKVGRNPMKNWKASYRNWCRNQYDRPKNKGNPFLEMLKKEYPEEANNIFPDNVVDTEGVEQ